MSVALLKETSKPRTMIDINVMPKEAFQDWQFGNYKVTSQGKEPLTQGTPPKGQRGFKSYKLSLTDLLTKGNLDKVSLALKKDMNLFIIDVDKIQEAKQKEPLVYEIFKQHLQQAKTFRYYSTSYTPKNKKEHIYFKISDKVKEYIASKSDVGVYGKRLAIRCHNGHNAMTGDYSSKYFSSDIALLPDNVATKYFDAVTSFGQKETSEMEVTKIEETKEAEAELQPQKEKNISFTKEDLGSICARLTCDLTPLMKTIVSSLNQDITSNRDLWIRIGQALAWCSMQGISPEEAYSFWLTISKKSKHWDEEECKDKWDKDIFPNTRQKVSNGESVVTVLFLWKIYNALAIKFPITDSKGKPNPYMIKNFLHLVNTRKLKTQEDVFRNEPRVIGPKEYIDLYFDASAFPSPKDGQSAILNNDQFNACIIKMAQEEGFNFGAFKSTIDHGKQWRVTTTETFNPYVELVESRPFDPKKCKSQIKEFINTLKLFKADIKKDDLTQRHLMRTMFGYSRGNFYKGPFNEPTGMLLLSGPENSNKSSGSKFLLPEELKKYIHINTRAFKKNNATDIEYHTKDIVLNLLSIYDEAGGFFSNNDGDVKRILTGGDLSVHKFREDKPVDVFYRGIHVGNLNLASVQMSSTGNRRLWQCAIRFWDTEELKTIDRPLLHAEFKYYFDKVLAKEGAGFEVPYLGKIYKVEHLWQLSFEDKNYLNTLNTNSRSKSDLVLQMEEVFETTGFKIDKFIKPSGAPLESTKKLGTIKSIKNILTKCSMEFNNHFSKGINLGELKRASEEIFSRYTNSQLIETKLFSGQKKSLKGILSNGIWHYSDKHKYFLFKVKDRYKPLLEDIYKVDEDD